MNGWTQADIDALKKKGIHEQRKHSLSAGVAVPVTDLERPARNAPLEKKESKRLDTSRRVRLRITGYRHRLCDPDGQSAKATIDGLVLAGILANDTSEQISGIEMLQVKI
jgi:hypothetical protein